MQCYIRSCPVDVKTTCYQTMIRSIQKYAFIVWSPYTQGNIHIIESVQRRSTKFVFNNYPSYDSVTNMLTHASRLEFPRTQTQRAGLIIRLHKLIHHLVDINTDDLLPLCPQHHPTHCHSQRFLQLQTRINAYTFQLVFFPNFIRLYMELLA